MKGERAMVGRKEGEESKGGTERRKVRTGNEYVNFTGHMDRKEKGHKMWSGSSYNTFSSKLYYE